MNSGDVNYGQLLARSMDPFCTRLPFFGEIGRFEKKTARLRVRMCFFEFGLCTKNAHAQSWIVPIQRMDFWMELLVLRGARKGTRREGLTADWLFPPVVM